VPIVGGIVVANLAYRFGTGFAKNQAAKNIPKMVEEQIKKASISIEDSSGKTLEYVLSQFQAHLDAVLDEKRRDLDSVIEESKKLNKEAVLQEIDQDLSEIGKLSSALITLGNAT
jgi:hypothetical protein